jgi:hypothetical protein
MRPGLAVVKRQKSSESRKMNQDLSFVQPVAQSPRVVNPYRTNVENRVSS